MLKQEPREITLSPQPDLPIKPHRGSIVDVVEATLTTGMGWSAYTATKHAVVGITRNGAFLYGCKGIRVNSISPGATLTKIALDNTNQEFKESLKQEDNPYVKPIALRTWALLEEQASVASFLLSPESSHVTGVNLMVDG